jgi:DNA repair exonuclease SbcCD ATPase subunit
MHRYNSIKRVEMPPDTGQMDALYEKIKETTLKLEKLSDGIQQLRFAEDRLRQATEKLQRMEQQLHESTRNQLCPICQRPM